MGITGGRLQELSTNCLLVLEAAARPLGRQMLVSLPPRIVDPPTAAHLHYFGICASYIAALLSSLTCQICLRDLFVFLFLTTTVFSCFNGLLL
jgi:hypothetical protein